MTTESEIISSLTFASYSHNRGLDPSITPERWAKIYGTTTMEMERLYQAKQKDWKAFGDTKMYSIPTIEESATTDEITWEGIANDERLGFHNA